MTILKTQNYSRRVMVKFSCVFLMLSLEYGICSSDSKRAIVVSNENSYQESAKSTTVSVTSIAQCSQKCFYGQPSCIGANLNTEQTNGQYQCELVHVASEVDGLVEKNGWIFFQLINDNQTTSSDASPKANHQVTTPVSNGTSCKNILERNNSAVNGVYWLQIGNETFQAFCDMSNGGFTLVARFSNNDAENWMNESGDLWYSSKSYGVTNSCSSNADMVNPAFSLVQGNDTKITRSDDPNHTALLVAPGCLKGNTTRAKITSYGDFRGGVIWSLEDRCLGSCVAIFSGSYETTTGFHYATSSCISTKDILNGNNIGFWCRYGNGDGSVIMIGGGGNTCGRADHGIAITEAKHPKFGDTHGHPILDFGDDGGGKVETGYSLNLWVR